MPNERWPELPYSAWKHTIATLQLWTQIVGKIRLARTPWLNHSWHVTLYVSARGLTTGPIPDGDRTFEIEFDFVAHMLRVTAGDGHSREVKLHAMTVAEFYAELMHALAALGIKVAIVMKPNEVAEPIPFDRDTVHKSYDADYANRFWRVLAASHQVMSHFRSGFLGKVSPVHFFWGSFDLA